MSAKKSTMENKENINEKATEAQAQQQQQTEQIDETDNASQNCQSSGTDTADDPMVALQAKYDELNNNHLRLMAEFDNYRKRTVREKADLIKNAAERIIVDFLPIIDNFERAIKSMETAEDVEAVRTGVELIYNQVMNMMKNNGVAVIETEGKEFDTEFHEAITTIPAPSPELKDKIIDCTTRGYTMNEKVIRHAKVVVGA